MRYSKTLNFISRNWRSDLPFTTFTEREKQIGRYYIGLLAGMISLLTDEERHYFVAVETNMKLKEFKKWEKV